MLPCSAAPAHCHPTKQLQQDSGFNCPLGALAHNPWDAAAAGTLCLAGGGTDLCSRVPTSCRPALLPLCCPLRPRQEQLDQLPAMLLQRCQEGWQAAHSPLLAALQQLLRVAAAASLRRCSSHVPAIVSMSLPLPCCQNGKRLPHAIPVLTIICQIENFIR